MPYTSTGHPNDHSTQVGAGSTFSISKFGSFIHNLVERGKYIVGELYLHHWLGSLCGHTNGRSDNALLCDGSIEHSIRTKLALKVHGAAKNSTKCHIFSKA
jgi:hypothetical protein